jgi:hypothetical protein
MLNSSTQMTLQIGENFSYMGISASDDKEDWDPVESPLNDITLPWDPRVHRPWMLPDTYTSENRPPAQILLTNFGWNNPDRAFGLKFRRFARERELFQGVINHPWFNPTDWEDIESGRAGIDPNLRYYVFLDVHQCFDAHYPVYHGFVKNGDLQMNRTIENVNNNHCPAKNR